MRKIPQQIRKLFLQHTPAYTRGLVERNINVTNLDSFEDKQIEPMLQYIVALQKHKEYLDFFEIGVVRDQRKKIQNVAKYVGLAIRDYSEAENDQKLQQMKKNKSHVDTTVHSEIIQNWSTTTEDKPLKQQEIQMKQNKKAQINLKK